MHQPDQALDVVYIIDRFPVASETFVQREVEALAKRDVRVRVRVLALRAFGAFDAEGVELYASAPSPKQALLWLHLGAFMLSHPRLGCRLLGAALRHESNAATAAFRVAIALHFAAVLEERPSVIHAHFASVPATVASLLSVLIDRPWGFSGHARDLYVGASDLPHRLASASHVLCCSETAAEHLRRLAPERSDVVHVLHHGLDLRRWPFQNGPRRAGARILAIGRFVSKKGFGTLIDACARLRDDGLVFECELIGEGPNREALETRITTHRLDSVVRISGWKTPAQVRDALSQATTLAVPSVIASDGDRDNIPNVLVEALATGVPVVASALASLERLAGAPAAFTLVPPGDVVALARALHRVCTDTSLARRLAMAGRTLVESKFDADHNIAALHAVLQRSADLKLVHTAPNCGRLALGTSRSLGNR